MELSENSVTDSGLLLNALRNFSKTKLLFARWLFFAAGNRVKIFRSFYTFLEKS